MDEPRLGPISAPIVEAIIDIDGDLPPTTDWDALDAAARAALALEYPTARKRMFNEHQIAAEPTGSVAVTSRQGLQALQYFTADERQIVQFRPAGFSFNRLAPYTSLDDYLPEIERTWQAFVHIAQPTLCRTVRIRFINRVVLPSTEGRVEIDEYLRLAPRLANEERFVFVGLFSQHSLLEPTTGNQANIVFATQDAELDRLPVILDIEVFKVADCEPGDWPIIAGRIDALRDLANVIFRNCLTDPCLRLFQPAAID